MIRKSIEELCECFNAKGKNLESKINELLKSQKIPTTLSESLHDLRLFGNDGAHIELKHFNNIGKQEVKIAIELLINLLEAIYEAPKKQELTVKRFTALKKN